MDNDVVWQGATFLEKKETETEKKGVGGGGVGVRAALEVGDLRKLQQRF